MSFPLQMRNWKPGFVRVAGGIILAAALVRLIGIIEPVQLLASPDPIVGIPLRYVAIIIGLFELAVGLGCLFGKDIQLQAGLILWLTTNFSVYRGGLLWMNHHPRCSGWGMLTNPLHLPLNVTDHAFLGSMAAMLIGSGVVLVAIWLQRVSETVDAGSKADETRSLKSKKPQSLGSKVVAIPETHFKIPCERCGGHIAFSTERIGQKISCPHCKARITLRPPEVVKSSCTSCGGNLEFPDYAVGQNITCPHCKATTVLQGSGGLSKAPSTTNAHE